MIVSGFTFFRNAVSLDYPFRESILSLLPLVDELIVNLGDSTDNTMEVVQSIPDPKIRIIETPWDPALCDNGRIFSVQTNIALEHVRKDADWAFYLQSDEVLHEKDYDSINKSMQKYKDQKEVFGLMFPYIQFIHDYHHLDPWAFRRAIRIIRPGGELISVGDSSGFVRRSDGKYLDKRNKELWRFADGEVYHYSSVKNPKAYLRKLQAQAEWYHGENPDEALKKLLAAGESIPDRYFISKDFGGTHPQVMSERIRSFEGTSPPKKNRWMNPDFYKYVLKHGFKG